MRPKSDSWWHIGICKRISNGKRKQTKVNRCVKHWKWIKRNAGLRKLFSNSKLYKGVFYSENRIRRDFVLGKGHTAEELNMSSLSLQTDEQSTRLSVNELLEIYRRQHGLECLSLKIRNQEPDGNCFFRCLSEHFTGRPDSHLHFRKTVVEYLKGLYLDKHPIPPTEVVFEDHVDNMVQGQTWATECEIYAASHMFNLRIDILTGGRGSPYIWTTTMPIDIDPNVALKSLRLLHRDRVHFDLIQEEW